MESKDRMSMMHEQIYRFKLVGTEKCGKHSLWQAMMQDQPNLDMSESSSSSDGVPNSVSHVSILGKLYSISNEATYVTISEKMTDSQILKALDYKGGFLLLLIFDLTDPNSFDVAERALTLMALQPNFNTLTRPVMVGTKQDLPFDHSIFDVLKGLTAKYDVVFQSTICGENVGDPLALQRVFEAAATSLEKRDNELKKIRKRAAKNGGPNLPGQPAKRKGCVVQ